MRYPSVDRVTATLAWLGTFGAALAVADLHYPGRMLCTLIFLLVTPAVCVAQLVPGLDPLARAVVSIAGGIVLISGVAEVMLAARWWTPRGGLIAVAALCAAVLAGSLIRRPRPAAADRPPGDRAAAGDDAWIYEE
jgi:hypothetical protein